MGCSPSSMEISSNMRQTPCEMDHSGAPCVSLVAARGDGAEFLGVTEGGEILESAFTPSENPFLIRRMPDGPPLPIQAPRVELLSLSS